MIKVIEYRSGEHKETKKEQPILKSSHDTGLISEDEIEDITKIIRRLWQRVNSCTFKSIHQRTQSISLHLYQYSIL